ncbi:MAG: YdeI/OmpD-associated family protein [Actinomycetia bacterium]|nr:YdeI/OmpD-associated family protein [Actinomycetes bacterium]
MPDDMYQALVDEGMMDTYEDRPDYQQNDYVGWINRAKKAETRQKRLDQMLDELRKGGVYMKMDHPPSARI